MLAIYGKKKTEKRFKGFDINSGQFVANKINLPWFEDWQKEELKNAVAFLNENNPDHVFEIRKEKW